jgi:phosphate starvation-inducible PhoH-like protein
LKNIDGVGFSYLDKKDVVRHKLVKDIIKAYEEFSNGNNRKEDKPDTKSDE